MKRKLWTLLLALGAALALCVGASAANRTMLETSHGGQTLFSGEYYLGGDVTISQTITVSGTVTLDLNGHVLQYKNDEVHGSPLAVEDGAHLTIKDSGSNATHKFAPNRDGLWVLDENGRETVYGGVITGGTGYQYQKLQPNGTIYTEEAGGGVCVKSGGKLTMEGGNIVGCSAMSGKGGGVYVESNFSMTGGSIIGCAADRGGGVYMSDDATVFNMSGSAAIRYCKAASKDSSYASGGGVYALGAFTMSGNAAICDCECIGQPARRGRRRLFSLQQQTYYIYHVRLCRDRSLQGDISSKWNEPRRRRLCQRQSVTHPKGSGCNQELQCQENLRRSDPWRRYIC